MLRLKQLFDGENAASGGSPPVTPIYAIDAERRAETPAQAALVSRLEALYALGCMRQSEHRHTFERIAGLSDGMTAVLAPRAAAVVEQLDALEAQVRARVAVRRAAWRRHRIAALALPVTEADTERLATDDLNQTELVTKAATWWAEARKPVLVLAGTVGRGKTLLACAAVLQREGGLYVGAREAERVFAAMYGDELQRQQEVLRASVLAVDDIGRERDAAAMGTALLEIVDARRRGLKTLLVTNLDRDQFEARYTDERLQSRMAESAMWAEDDGEDLRKPRRS